MRDAYIAAMTRVRLEYDEDATARSGGSLFSCMFLFLVDSAMASHPLTLTCVASDHLPRRPSGRQPQYFRSTHHLQ